MNSKKAKAEKIIAAVILTATLAKQIIGLVWDDETKATSNN